jgi:hypothetical protein
MHNSVDVRCNQYHPGCFNRHQSFRKSLHLQRPGSSVCSTTAEIIPPKYVSSPALDLHLSSSEVSCLPSSLPPSVPSAPLPPPNTFHKALLRRFTLDCENSDGRIRLTMLRCGIRQCYKARSVHVYALSHDASGRGHSASVSTNAFVGRRHCSGSNCVKTKTHFLKTMSKYP